MNLDRLDHEVARAGYLGAAHLLVTCSIGTEGGPGPLMAPRLLARVIEDRIRRTRLDLAELAAQWQPGPSPHSGWGLYAALDAALEASAVD